MMKTYKLQQISEITIIDTGKEKLVRRRVSTPDNIKTSSQIYNFLKQVEKTEGFKGFTEIHFTIDNYPTLEFIVCK